MGTSTSYPGPTRNNPLLPPWAADPLPPLPLPPYDEQPPPNVAPPSPENDEAPPAPVDTPQATPDIPISPLSSWRAPKSALTRRARGNDRVSFGTISRGYVRASGGHRQAAATARAGRAATVRLGRFLAAGLRNGFAQVAQQLGLQNFVGRDAQFVLAAFIDLLAPAGAMREEAIARQAMIDTLSDWFDQLDVIARGFDALDALTPETMADLIILSVANYVNVRFQQELVSRIERGTLPEREANQLAAEAKEFIAEIIQIDFRGVDLVQVDWQGAEGRDLIAGIYETAYSLLGDAP